MPLQYLKLLLIPSLIHTHALTIPVVKAAATATATAAILKDHSSTATALFNNMRTPAALIGGAIVPLGILSAPPIKDTDSRRTTLFKKANLLLAIASLLSEIIAITYATIAINKIAELDAVPTAGVSALMDQHYLVPWVGTNVHFLLGLFGFGLLVIGKPFFMYGKDVGTVAACWSGAAMAFCVSIVNKGIEMGSGAKEDATTRITSNLFFLVCKYVRLLWGQMLSGGGVMGVLVLGLVLGSVVPITQIWGKDDNEKAKAE